MHAPSRQIGEFLVDIGAMTREQLNNTLVAQIRGDTRLFGEIAISRQYIDDAALRKYVEAYCGLPDFGECEEVEI